MCKPFEDKEIEDLSLEHVTHTARESKFLKSRCYDCFVRVRNEDALKNPYGDNYPIGYVPE